jgi:hypothetical protein
VAGRWRRRGAQETHQRAVVVRWWWWFADGAWRRQSAQETHQRAVVTRWRWWSADGGEEGHQRVRRGTLVVVVGPGNLPTCRPDTLVVVVGRLGRERAQERHQRVDVTRWWWWFARWRRERGRQSAQETHQRAVVVRWWWWFADGGEEGPQRVRRGTLVVVVGRGNLPTCRRGTLVGGGSQMEPGGDKVPRKPTNVPS